MPLAIAIARRFAAGEDAPCGSTTPGDLVFTHRSSLVPRLIRLGQRWRFRHSDERPFAYWSHCAIVVDDLGSIVEAESAGVERNTLSKYRQTEYHVVSLGRDFKQDDRIRATEYAQAQVGRGFGFLVLLSLSVWLLTGFKLKLARADHQICSGLVAHALQDGHKLMDLDPTFVLPADLAKRLQVRP